MKLHFLRSPLTFQHAGKKLGGGMTDIEDLVLRHASHGETQEHLALQPVVTETANLRPTPVYLEQKGHWKRNIKRNTSPDELKNDFSDIKPTVMKEAEAIREAARCLKCADAPCQKGCPTAIDIKGFIACIANGNWYGAAKIILTDNPCGLSCGMVCATSDLCTGSCNLSNSAHGAINISGLQEFAIQKFRQLGILPSLTPAIAGKAKLGDKIALLGLGPASIGCATFLARLGYNNVHVFEREAFGGGISSTEIPQFRLTHEAVEYEVELMKSLGVHIHYKHSLAASPKAANEVNLASLRADGYKAVFVGVGRDKPIVIPEFAAYGVEHGLYTSKDFLPHSCKSSKPILAHRTGVTELPQLHGKVIVLGGGDVAADCAQTAFRCGARHVTLVFRKNTTDLRAMPEEVEHMMHEQIDFLPYCLPKQVILDEATGRVKAVEFYKQEKGLDGQYYTDEDQFIRVKCDFVITAFGANADKALLAPALAPLALNRWGQIDVNEYGASTEPGVFAGGDVIGASTTVGSVNDGKAAAWGIHTYLQKLDTAATPVSLPKFHTPIDDVDLSVTVAGIKFPNPFGLASAPPTTSKDMIARSFAAGWGFAVTKTFTVEKDLVTNVSPRIMSSVISQHDMNVHKAGWMNIELVSEKYPDYWYNAIKELKEEYPAHVVVSSIMAAHDKEAWQELARKSEIAGADAIEMNLSCPHGMHEQGMGLELGVYPDKVREVVGWVVEAVKIPVFAKLTPNITDITVVAAAAREAGAAGVTAINTVSGFVGFKSNLNAMRWGVGKDHVSCYGGLCGPNVRPLALRAVSAINRKLPDCNIMATGGVDSADTTLMFMLAGAPLMQICTPVMNQDYTVVDDFISGLKTLLYLQGQTSLAAALANKVPVNTADMAVAGVTSAPGASRYQNWNFQSPDYTEDKAFGGVEKKFGPYEVARRKQQTEGFKTWKITDITEADLDVVRAEKPMLREEAKEAKEACAKGDACCKGKSGGSCGSSATAAPTKPITASNAGGSLAAASIEDLVGLGCKQGKIVNHAQMSRTQQVVALINEDLCLNCGRCYMACNDNAYQAISFDAKSHIATVMEDRCTGCGICESVCPAPQCIQFVPRTDLLETYRGDDYIGKEAVYAKQA